MRSKKPTGSGSSTVVEICSHHLHTRPKPPSARAPDIPHDLEALVLGCLEKAPGDRPATASAFLDALARTEAHGRWSHEDSKAWWEHHADDVARSRRQPTVMSSRTFAIER